METVKLSFVTPSKSDYLTFAGMGSNASISHNDNLVVIFDIQDNNPFIEVYCEIDGDQGMAQWEGNSVAWFIRNMDINATVLANALSVAQFDGLAKTMNATQIGY